MGDHFLVNIPSTSYFYDDPNFEGDEGSFAGVLSTGAHWADLGADRPVLISDRTVELAGNGYPVVLPGFLGLWSGKRPEAVLFRSVPL